MNTKPPRAIKFRAWDREEKTMIDADSWFFSEEFEPFIDSVERCMRRFDLMQFTGLLDKNGTEIYEGDVVRSPSGEKHEIKWVFGSFCPGGWLDEAWWKDCEVLGKNIHQHPDLLKKE